MDEETKGLDWDETVSHLREQAKRDRRDRFAMAALAGLCANPNTRPDGALGPVRLFCHENGQHNTGYTLEQVAASEADALIGMLDEEGS